MWAPNQIRDLGDDIDPPETIGHQTLRVGTKKNSIAITQQQQHLHQIGMTSFPASKHVITSWCVSCLLFFWAPVGFALWQCFNVFVRKGFGNGVVFKQAMLWRPVSKSSINGLSFGNSTARSASSSAVLVTFFSLVALTILAFLAACFFFSLSMSAVTSATVAANLLTSLICFKCFGSFMHLE